MKVPQDGEHSKQKRIPWSGKGVMYAPCSDHRGRVGRRRMDGTERGTLESKAKG